MNLFISFSGGESSALMTNYLLDLQERKKKWDQVVVIFANTGMENEETLDFVRLCDKEYDFNTVWVEAVIHPKKGVGTTHKITNFDNACRNAEPFRSMIKKFGIPNNKFPHCTRELKTRPMESYIKNLGWKRGEYEIAIGIRADEPARRSKLAKDNFIIYPLMDMMPMTKPQVNEFWHNEPERLKIFGFQGNCKTCWKKSIKKLLAIMDFWPEHFDFFDEMESEFGLIGPEFEKETAPGYKRVFFRGNRSVKDLKSLIENDGSNFNISDDDSLILPNGEIIDLNTENDDGSGCTESCEIDPIQLSLGT